jgi:hypothetical protein
MCQQTPTSSKSSLLQAQEGDVLGLDKMWLFVQHKKKITWLWFAQCRRSR